MRRYTSILMLGARGVVMPLIVVLLLMGAAEAGLVFRGISGGWNPEWFWSESRVVWAYRAALVLLAAACCVHVSGLGGSRVYYTMHRLRLSEWTVTVLLGLCGAVGGSGGDPDGCDGLYCGQCRRCAPGGVSDFLER